MSYLKAECPEGVKNNVQELAKKRGESEADIIRRAVQNYIRQEKEKGGPVKT